MDRIQSDKAISIRELALFAFAGLLLLAAAPSPVPDSSVNQQPVNLTVPADEEADTTVKTA